MVVILGLYGSSRRLLQMLIYYCQSILRVSNSCTVNGAVYVRFSMVTVCGNSGCPLQPPFDTDRLINGRHSGKDLRTIVR
jgi:hypothetical protein